MLQDVTVDPVTGHGYIYFSTFNKSGRDLPCIRFQRDSTGDLCADTCCGERLMSVDGLNRLKRNSSATFSSHWMI